MDEIREFSADRHLTQALVQEAMKILALNEQAARLVYLKLSEKYSELTY